MFIASIIGKLIKPFVIPSVSTVGHTAIGYNIYEDLNNSYYKNK